MPEARWKRHERQVARALGAAREPNTGQGRPDILTAAFAIEHKLRGRLPQWLVAAVEQAQRNAPAGRCPLLVLSYPAAGRRTARLVVLTWDAFLVLARRAEEGQGA